MPQSPEMWRFPAVGLPPSQAMGLFAGRMGGDASVEVSTVTEQSWGSKGCRRRRGGPDDESSKLISPSSGDGRNDSGVFRGFCKMLASQNPQAVETPKRDFIHVRARRGQATDSHSLAERARREKISERMKILQDLVPGCNKVIGKASVLDEIINYIQALQHQVEFLSMKLEAVNAPLSTSIKVFPPRDICGLAYDTTSGLAFSSQASREYEQDPGTRWLQMQVGSDFGRVETMARDDSTMDNKSTYRQIPKL